MQNESNAQIADSDVQVLPARLLVEDFGTQPRGASGFDALDRILLDRITQEVNAVQPGWTWKDAWR